ncbi:MAG: hypothetical protein BVN29_18265 [Nitrospira sp. ST-bin5]|nr:MAG: hypothetical protein BVN29_18265 [Nitrospira sp. ST-bin5]
MTFGLIESHGWNLVKIIGLSRRIVRLPFNTLIEPRDRIALTRKSFLNIPCSTPTVALPARSAYSGPNVPPIPVETSHLFQSKSATRSDGNRPPVPVKSAIYSA